MSHTKKGVTLTFGDVSENFVGMAKQGKLHESGFTHGDLIRIAEMFPENAEMYDLRGLLDNHSNVELPQCYVLILRNPFPELVEPLTEIMLRDEEMFDDNGNLVGVEWDKCKVQRRKVVNSRARYNLCFSDLGPADSYKYSADFSDVANANGTVYNINSIEPLRLLHEEIKKFNVGTLEVEGNYYYDLEKTYIGFHGDRERKKVIGYRLGDVFPLHFRWHHHATPISEHATVLLNPGDMYLMMEFAAGFSKMKKTAISIKHAAGFPEIIFTEK